ncbi:hypothetical protein C8R47DRAFT_751078 [Mycena vitilis]|nr:hypothetical protein C8R47DRAFT_751078 [Mycena vitilis]
MDPAMGDGSCAAWEPPQARKVVFRGVRQQLDYVKNLVEECHRHREQDQREREHVRVLSAQVLELRQQLHGTRAIVVQTAEARLELDDALELREAVSLCLRGYNDIVFDTHRSRFEGRRVMSKHIAKTLKQHQLGLLSQLINPPPSAVKTLRTDPQLQDARTKALGVLSSAEHNLCIRLLNMLKPVHDSRGHSGWQQHPRPDRQTASDRILGVLAETEVADTQAVRSHCDTLHALLSKDPRRLPSSSERDDEGNVHPTVDLRIFAKDGDYRSALEKRKDVARLRAQHVDEEKKLNAIVAAQARGAEEPRE